MYDGLVHIQKDFANMLTLHKKTAIAQERTLKTKLEISLFVRFENLK